MLIRIPDLLNLHELSRLRALIKESVFEDGRESSGFRARRVKNNLQLSDKDPKKKEIEFLVAGALARNKLFLDSSFPRVIRPPLISCYRPGMGYGTHVDSALVGDIQKVRSDISVTVFISDFDGYEGGYLVIQSPYGEQQVKLPAGAAVIYPSSTLHHVTPVTQGERIAAVTWVESYVREPAKREILHDLNRIQNFLAEVAKDADEADLAFKTYSNLLRMWSET